MSQNWWFSCQTAHTSPLRCSRTPPLLLSPSYPSLPSVHSIGLLLCRCTGHWTLFHLFSSFQTGFLETLCAVCQSFRSSRPTTNSSWPKSFETMTFILCDIPWYSCTMISPLHLPSWGWGRAPWQARFKGRSRSRGGQGWQGRQEKYARGWAWRVATWLHWPKGSLENMSQKGATRRMRKGCVNKPRANQNVTELYRRNMRESVMYQKRI